MSKIFLDVGAHMGETLSVVVEPRWGFDRIYAFEPAPECWETLRKVADDRVTMLPFGLLDEDVQLDLFDPGEIGASIYASKSVLGIAERTQFRDAGKWFRSHLHESDEIVMKVNCEGSEVRVLRRLLDTGELDKVACLLVHWDIRKVPEAGNQAAVLISELRSAGIPFRSAETIMFGRNVQDKTRNWLSWYHVRGWRRARYSVVRRVEFAARVALYRLRQRASNREIAGRGFAQ
jgi:FkbM family methyltransferase